MASPKTRHMVRIQKDLPLFDVLTYPQTIVHHFKHHPWLLHVHAMRVALLPWEYIIVSIRRLVLKNQFVLSQKFQCFGSAMDCFTEPAVIPTQRHHRIAPVQTGTLKPTNIHSVLLNIMNNKTIDTQETLRTHVRCTSFVVCYNVFECYTHTINDEWMLCLVKVESICILGETLA
eukprot:1154741_1